MGKFDLDNLMGDLGISDNETEKPARAPAETPTPPMQATAQPAPAQTPSVDRDAPPDQPRPDVATRAIYDPTADDAQEHHDEDLLDMVEREGILEPADIASARNIVAKSPGMSLVGILLDAGADEIKLLQCVARFNNLPFERLDESLPPDERFDGALLQRMSVEACKRTEILPLRTEGDRVVVGTPRPDDVFAIDDARVRLKARSLRVVVLPGSDIKSALEPFEQGAEEDVDVDNLLDDIDEDDVLVDDTSQDQETDLEREAAESPVIRYVNFIIQSAVKEGASDIHIEPGEKALKVRFRIDGVLFESMHPPAKMAAAITSRLKIMANLDIAERRVPQDGRIRCTVNNRKLDLRMSTLPTPNGEKTVLRILDTKSINVELDDLGFDENTLETWKTAISQPHGIVLVTGPTGSGKTTTLYASLRQMDKKTKNVSTVEDPVEYHLDGITQTQTHERAGMTFAKALKALLRQDPDVIMLGEIRDLETATIAVQASLTGHLVLSTLHTNDAPSSVTRLINIGIEPFLIGAALNATLAQRLVRRICKHCVKEAEMTESLQEFADIQGFQPGEIKEGAGCPKCRGTGYSGRVGLYELLVVDDHTRDIIARNPNVTEFRRECVSRGMRSLMDDGFQKVREGRTTIQEIRRVVEAGH
ncbi:MAG: type IV-A pilus assembly ATPase PilB [Phycisphaerales bacterium]